MTTDVDQLIERIAAEAEETKDDPMPEGVRPTKPNKSVPVAVRLASAEVDAINVMAQRLGVPVSALLRGWIIEGLHGDRSEPVDLALKRLEDDVRQVRYAFIQGDRSAA